MELNKGRGKKCLKTHRVMRVNGLMMNSMGLVDSFIPIRASMRASFRTVRCMERALLCILTAVQAKIAMLSMRCTLQIMLQQGSNLQEDGLANGPIVPYTDPPNSMSQSGLKQCGNMVTLRK